MAGSLSALVFPYTELPDQAWESLTDAFAQTYLLQAAGMAPSPGLEPHISSGAVELIRPGHDLLGPEEINPLLAETMNWVSNIRDIKEIAHLKAALGRESEERSPSALATAIRRHGKEEKESGLLFHLLLHLAAWHDQRERESDQAVKALESKERALKESLGGGLDREEGKVFQALVDPLAPGRTPDDPLMGLRLEAWSRLFSQTKVKADLWVTGPAVIRHLAGVYEERTGEPPASLKEAAPEQARTALERTGLAQLTGPGFTFLTLWYFEKTGLAELLGLEALAGKAEGVIGEIGWS